MKTKSTILILCTAFFSTIFGQNLTPYDILLFETVWRTGPVTSYEIESGPYVIYQTTITRSSTDAIVETNGGINSTFGDEEYKTTSSIIGNETTYVCEMKEPSNGINSFVLTDKNYFYSDGVQDTAVIKEYYDETTGLLQSTSKSQILYNGNLISEFVESSYNTSTSLYETSRKAELFYNGTQQLDSTASLYFSGGVYAIVNYEKYYYNGSLLDSSVVYSNSSGSWIRESKNVYVQDVNFKTIEMEQFDWDSSTGTYSGGATWVFNRMTPSSISESELQNLTIFPNPSSDWISINGIQKNMTISILNVNGQIMQKESLTPGDKIDISHLENGTYFLKTENGVLKFIKQ